MEDHLIDQIVDDSFEVDYNKLVQSCCTAKEDQASDEENEADAFSNSPVGLVVLRCI